ncbi:MAG: DEAD/DEAH box helicase family protein [Calditrichaceae bacterium]
MADKILYEELDAVSNMGFLKKEIPVSLKDNLNPKFELRPYQEEAFARFFHCFHNDFPGKDWPLHFLFNMATGSGKTLIMAGLILYLYEQGYRNFLFFVNSTNIIEKTKDNFQNPISAKYLFNSQINIHSKIVNISQVDNFEATHPDEISIAFTTIQKLHFDLTIEKENALTYEDFKDKNIVLIADEAHHMSTKTKSEKQLFNSWEDTVERIFHQSEDNLLLEFTATLDYTHRHIVDKYLNKVIYRYDLKEFRNDRYSKDVFIVQADLDENDRIIQALVLNQYKQEVAARHRINLKPVILFKAQRTIEQSKVNKANFHKLISELTTESLRSLRSKTDIFLVKRAFVYFKENNISLNQLVVRIKTEFNESRCLSVNEEKEKETQQILINSLEDKDNPIRAIFAVQKLNEGWDVLNLFDIVRCYETRDSKGGKPGQTTISEAQLIGRGARYFPFIADGKNDKFMRKYDDNLKHELRILEELHYHSINDSRYISELRTALINEGLLDDDEVVFPLELKDNFRQDSFYEKGLIYINERVKNRYEQVNSFADFGVMQRNFSYSIATGHGISETLFNAESKLSTVIESGRKDVKMSDIPNHIIKNSISRNTFYKFSNLKEYFPRLKGMDEFIKSDDYLNSLSITFQGEGEELYKLSNLHLLGAVSGLLSQIEIEIRQNITEYKGTSEFKPYNLSKIFENKILKLHSNNERANGDEQFVGDKDWYVFNANYGTSEEKAFVRMLDRQMDSLRKNYDGIYLIRNENHFKIYNFSDGRAFEPDFVLFLKEKAGQLLTYQLFVEPKGKHLKEHDKWKQDFLKEISKRFAGKLLDFSKSKKYRLIGVPFYNNEDENKFKQHLFDSLHNSVLVDDATKIR